LKQFEFAGTGDLRFETDIFSPIDMINMIRSDRIEGLTKYSSNSISSKRQMISLSRSRAFTHPPLNETRILRNSNENQCETQASQDINTRNTMEAMSHSQSFHALNDQLGDTVRVTFIDEIADKTGVQTATVTPQDSPNFSATQSANLSKTRTHRNSNCDDLRLARRSMEIDNLSQELPSLQVNNDRFDPLGLQRPSELTFHSRGYDRAYGYPVVRPRFNQNGRYFSRDWTRNNSDRDLPLIPSLSASMEDEDGNSSNFPPSSSPPSVATFQRAHYEFPLSIPQVGDVSISRFASQPNELRSRSLLRRPNPRYHQSLSLREALGNPSLYLPSDESLTQTNESSFPWKNYPKLESYLFENSEEYYRHFAPEQKHQQCNTKDVLTERLLNFAIQIGYNSFEHPFSDANSLQNAIHSFFKNPSRSQHLSKKRNISSALEHT